MKVHELLTTLEPPPEYAWVTPSFQLYLNDKCIYDSEGKDPKEYYRAKAKYANYEVKWATIAVDDCDYGCLIIHMESEDKNNNNDENSEKWRHFELTTSKRRRCKMRQVSENEFYAYINEYDHYYEFNDELKVKNAPYNEYLDIKENRTDRLLGRISTFLLDHKLKYVYEIDEIQEVKTMAEIIINKEKHECPPAVAAYVKELRKENARLEELYQKSVGVIAATDCVECKGREYLKAYNDVMMLRANIQEIIEDVSKKNGDVNNENKK